MSKGKRNKKAKKVHKNKYEKFSQADDYIAKRLADEARQAKQQDTPAPRYEPPSRSYSSLYSSGFERSLGLGFSSVSLRSRDSRPTYRRLDNLDDSSSRESESRRGNIEDSGVSDSRNSVADDSDVSDVKKFGCWWEYQGYKFIMKGMGELGNGFERSEVKEIGSQLIQSEGDVEYPLVTCSGKSFFVHVRGDFVEVAYTRYIDGKWQEQYATRRTDKVEELVR